MMTTTAYEMLIASAARLTEVDALSDVKETNLSSASDLLQRNQLALQSARSALGPECIVPVRYEEAFLSEHCHHLSHLRNLARAFHAEAWLAACRSDFPAAARAGIDTLELANATRRGGLLIDLLVGVAISGVAIDALRKIRSKLDNDTRWLVIDRLHRLDSERESFSDVVARDRDWEVAVGYQDKQCDFLSHEPTDPAKCGLSEEEQKAMLQLLQQTAGLPEPEQRRMQRNQDFRILALMRMLAIDLVLRDYHDTSGSYPDDLASITSQHFSQLTLDPYTDQSFIYRRLGKSFCLYSTGPKLPDGGGRFGPWPNMTAGCNDFGLDAGDYWIDGCALQQRSGLTQGMRLLTRRWWYAWRR